MCARCAVARKLIYSWFHHRARRNEAIKCSAALGNGEGKRLSTRLVAVRFAYLRRGGMGDRSGDNAVPNRPPHNECA